MAQTAEARQETPVEMRRYNKRYNFGGKLNSDGGYSVRIPAGQLVDIAFVDFYEERTGGYQRNEPTRERRGAEIAAYIERCKESNQPIHLFELTANARVQEDSESDGVADSRFAPYGEDAAIGTLELRARGDKWLAVIDGGTRLRGIEMALEAGTLDPNFSVDVRMTIGHSVVEESALFMLINDNQKKVQTALTARVVQRMLDEGQLTEEEMAILQTVVPDTDKWNYEAVRIASRLNSERTSAWRKLIQMPGEREVKPIKLQAFSTSLKKLLNDEELSLILSEMELSGDLRMAEGDKKLTRTDFLRQVLKNFWGAVAETNPRAFEEPSTNVLWGAVGVSASHLALVPILVSILSRPDPNVSQKRFTKMLKGSIIEDYDFWFTKPGDVYDSYPNEKGKGTWHIGASGYMRLGRALEKEWRKNLPVRAAGPVKA